MLQLIVRIDHQSVVPISHRIFRVLKHGLNAGQAFRGFDKTKMFTDPIYGLFVLVHVHLLCSVLFLSEIEHVFVGGGVKLPRHLLGKILDLLLDDLLEGAEGEFKAVVTGQIEQQIVYELAFA